MVFSNVAPVAARNAAVASTTSRQKIVQAYGVVNHWLIKAWADQSIQCELFLEGDARPDEEEIRLACGEQVALEWAATPGCKDSTNPKNSNSCDGLYLVYLGKHAQSYQTVQQLPTAKAYYHLDHCENGAWCDERPSIFFYGVEPLEGEQISAIRVRAGTKEIGCLSTIGCQVYVPTTTERGTWLEYWVESSYGDESEHLYLYMRNVYRFGNPSKYFLEVLSPELTSDAAELQWTSFPSIDHANADFYSSANIEGSLATDNHLYYLSGKLINGGEVDTRRCTDGVLLTNGNAGVCGEESAYQAVVDWQNQYDRQILDAARVYGLPGKIVKGILAQESQFWADPQIPYEYGLGSLTQNGIDALLGSDPEHFLKVCIPALGETDCASGYAALTSKQRAELRGLVLRAVGTDAEVDLIARVLLAQVIQVGQVTQDVTKDIPGQAAAYEDLWDLTIASYHAGTGCINQGLQKLKKTGQKITFENFCSVSTAGCQSGCTFTQKVKDYAIGESENNAADREN